MAEQLVPTDDPSPKRRKHIVMILLGIVVALVLGAVAFLNWQMGSVAGANPDDPAQVAMGQAVYQQNCASCHGVKLEGQPDWRVRKQDGRLPAPPHDKTGHTWHHPDKDLFSITKIGVQPPLAPAGYESDMPPFDDVLSDEEIWAVLSFIKNSWPSKFRARQIRKDEASRQ